MPSSVKCNPFSHKFSKQMLLLTINPNLLNLPTRFRILFTAIALLFTLSCALTINDEIKTSFTLLSLHCRPIIKIYSSISFSPSCLFPISLQPMRNIKTSDVSLISHMLPINVINQMLDLFKGCLGYKTILCRKAALDV